MIHVVKRNNNLPAVLNGGLNGWFGRLVKKLCKAAIDLVQRTPIVGLVFANELTQLDTVVDQGNFNFRTAPDYEPTASEAAILESWASSKLNPFYKTMVEQLSSAFANANINTQLQLINNVVLKMCVVKQYFAKNETVGLSTDAVLSRMAVINKIFEPVEGLIAKSVADYSKVLELTPYAFNFTTSTMGDFSPLLTRVSAGIVFNCNKYVATETPNIKPTKPNIPVTPVKVTTPVTTTPIKTTPGSTTPVSTTPVKTTPVTTTPTTTTPVTTTPEDETVEDEEKDKKINWLLWAVGAYAIYRVGKKILT